MTSSRSSSLPQPYIFAIASQTRLPVDWQALTVAMLVPAGNSALFSVPGSETMSMQRITAPCDQGRSWHNSGKATCRMPPTRPDQVQLTVPGTCGSVPVKSKVRWSPFLVIASRSR